jgi:uncharacterized membrane protein
MRILATTGGVILGGLFFGFARPGMTLIGLVIGGVIGHLWGGLAQLTGRVRVLESQLARSQSGARTASPEAETPAAAERPQPLAPEPKPPIAEPMRASATAVPPNPVDTAVVSEAHYSEVPPETLLFAKLKAFLTGGNTIVRVGVIVLFFGVAFLLKYSVEHATLPIEARLIGAALGAIVLLVLGWRLRHRRAAYAVALQGGAVGILYLTVFASLRLYALVAPGAALVALAAMAVFSAMLAVLQNARALAVLAAAGGFLAPVLASTGGGSHVMLFSYYALLNAAILGIAWFRAWRELNLLGFVFTFVIGALWGHRSYEPVLFASTEPFLILFFVFYVVIAVLFALRQPTRLKGYVDGTLVFGVPVVGFALQAVLMHPYEYGLAWSALALGAFYLVLATMLFKLHRAPLRTLTEAFLALGVVFTTLAIPLAFDGRWTAAAWAVEGAGIIWVSARQHHLLGRVFGALLILSAGAMFTRNGQGGLVAVLNGDYLGRALIAVAAFFGGWQFSRVRSDARGWERAIVWLLFCWGLVWWYGGGLLEIERYAPDHYNLSLVTAFVALSGLLAELVGARFEWPTLRFVAYSALPLGLVLALLSWMLKPHPFADGGYLGWSFLLAGHYAMLRRQDSVARKDVLQFLHGATLWLVALLGAQEWAYGVDVLIGDASAWKLVGWGMVPALLLFLVTGLADRNHWPWSRHREAYLAVGSAPLAVWAAAWSVYANLNSTGAAAPLPYVPFLNPLDVTQAAVLVAGTYWIQRMLQTQREPVAGEYRRTFAAAGAALVFLWLNGVLLRTIHHWAGVPFEWQAMLDSVIVQTALSIFWALLALALMFIATRRTARVPWLTGAILLAIVVVKLFAVDLSRTSAVPRIVSFIVVGILLLLIGYLAPVPPKQVREEVAP